MLNVIVPYRNREAHLERFLPVMYHYLAQHLAGPFTITIVEQADKKPFNRAKLLNIGTQFTTETTYFAFHDIDHLPINVDYSYPEQPTQLVASGVQQIGYFGGVSLINKTQFANTLDGYSNNFWGWGGEDNEMCNRLHDKGLPLINRFGTFDMLPHAKAGRFDAGKMAQAARPRDINDGLHNTVFTLITMHRRPLYNARHIFVEL
jgi:beta-1,4-galactosyltransferase 1